MPDRPNAGTTHELYAISGNRCAFAADPTERCTQPITREGKNLGEMAHILGNKPGTERTHASARYDESQSDEERHHGDNLILLCRPHHKMIDADPHLDPHPVRPEFLRDLKARHQQAMSKAPAPPGLSDEAVAELIELTVTDSAVAIAEGDSSFAIAQKAHTINNLFQFAGAAPAFIPSDDLGQFDADDGAAAEKKASRWWCLPGDHIWNGDDHVARFQYDSGGQWGLFIATYRESAPLKTVPRAPTFLWDYGACSLDGPLGGAKVELTSDERASLRAKLESISPLVLDRESIHGQIIEAVAGAARTEGYIDGVTLRSKLPVSKGAARRAVSALIPRYVTHDGVFRTDEDHYSITIAGFAVSSEGERAWKMAADILAVIRDTFAIDVRMKIFSWADVQAKGGYTKDDLRFCRSVIKAAGWSQEFFAKDKTHKWELRIRRDQEDYLPAETLKDCQSFAHYLDKVRGCDDEIVRPWPTAPARLV